MANSIFQLRSGGFCEGHNQQLFQPELSLCHQSQDKVSESKGFARASTGFYETNPCIEGVLIGFKTAAHDRCASSMGAYKV